MFFPTAIKLERGGVKALTALPLKRFFFGFPIVITSLPKKIAEQALQKVRSLMKVTNMVPFHKQPYQIEISSGVPGCISSTYSVMQSDGNS